MHTTIRNITQRIYYNTMDKIIAKILVRPAMLLLFACAFSTASAQSIDGYRFMKRIRGVKITDTKVSEIKIEEQHSSVVVGYRDRRTMYVAIFRMGSWDKVGEYRIGEVGELHSSYFNETGTEYFVNIDPYKLIFKRINLETQETEDVQCNQTPKGCYTIERRMPSMRVFNSDRSFLFTRDEGHQNDILVYMEEIRFQKVRAEMIEALQREVLIREVKEKLENDARQTQTVPSGVKVTASEADTETDEELEQIIITQEDIMMLMATGKLQKAGMTVSLEPGLKIKVDNSSVSTLDKPLDKYTAGDIIKLETIEFDQGRSTISQSSHAELDKLVALMKKFSNMHIQVNGHTNNIGTHNQEISEARAKSVMEYLESKGIDASRIRYRGYGDTQPVASNKTDEGLARNRRVDIEIIKQ
jgi:outer membrane protein OmpA-like peptidoglycan-associated protein